MQNQQQSRLDAGALRNKKREDRGFAVQGACHVFPSVFSRKLENEVGIHVNLLY